MIALDITAILISIVSMFIGFTIGFAVSFFVRDALQTRTINRLYAENSRMEAELYANKQREYGNAGNQAKREKAERMQGMIIEFAAAMKKPDAKIDEVVKGIATNYPDIAMDLVKKGMKI